MDKLLEAATDGNLEKFEEALKSITDLNIKNDKGLTPLHLVALHGHTEICKAILARVDNISTQDKDGKN